MTEHKPVSADGRDRASAKDRTAITRGRFLAGGVAVVGGLALGTDALAGIRVRDRLTAADLRRAAAAPKRGGTLTVGSIGSTGDSLDPNLELSNMELQRNFNFYDTLTYFPHDGFNLQYGLAESIELTQGATVATVRLRKGVEWHNGKSLTRGRPHLHDQPGHRAQRPACGPPQVDQPQGAQEDRRADGADRAELRGRDLPGAVVRPAAVDPAGRLEREEPGRNRAVQVQELHPRPAERVRPQPELLDVRQALPRRARDHRPGRPDRADQRAAQRAGRRDRLGPAQRDLGDQRTLRTSSCSRRTAATSSRSSCGSTRSPSTTIAFARRCG